jgi:DNA-binding MarR family transcriptional regulator
MPKDSADLHVERWRDHWIDITFDDEVEAMTVRVIQVSRYLREAKQAAVAQMELQDFEYDTLHTLMIRDTPGHASPGALAQDLGVSNAGMTGRLDTLEKRGWIKRMPGADDRRRVDVEVTRSGAAVWRRAMELRGTAEDELASAITRRELVTLNRLLKKLTLRIETAAEGAAAAASSPGRVRPSAGPGPPSTAP